jgi:hypothetical protein
MKNWIGTLLMALFAVFLVCDPQVGVTQYQLEVNGVVGNTFVAETDGSAKISLDEYVPGNYVFRLSAADDKGWWSDFSDPFDATKPGKSGGVRIEGR